MDTQGRDKEKVRERGKKKKELQKEIEMNQHNSHISCS